MEYYNRSEKIQVPRFKEENGFYASEASSKHMAKIKGKNTKPEYMLRIELFHRGLRYRKNNKQLPGNPDISIKKYGLAVFVDGSFWHGYNWEEKRERIKKNRDFWIAKIERNIQRDKENNAKLEALGFDVVRFWDFDIKKNLDYCASYICDKVGEKKHL